MSKDPFIHATQVYIDLLYVFDHMTHTSSLLSTRITIDGVTRAAESAGTWPHVPRQVQNKIYLAGRYTQNPRVKCNERAFFVKRYNPTTHFQFGKFTQLLANWTPKTFFL